MDTFYFTPVLREQEEGKLSIRLQPEYGISPGPITESQVRTLFDQSEYSDWYFLDSALPLLLEADKELTSQCNQMLKDYFAARKSAPVLDATADIAGDAPADDHLSEEPGSSKEEALGFLEKMGMEYPEFLLAERRNGEAVIDVDDDALAAFVSFTPPYGGSPADTKTLVSALHASGIKKGVIKENVQRAVDTFNKTHSRVLIARGRPARKGKNASFQPLVQSVITHNPKETEGGKVDYLDIVQFVLVEPGTPLMKRIAPQPGQPGEDVYGRPIPAEQGDLVPFAPDIEGAEVSGEDENLLVASIKGHPILHERGVSVDPALVVNNVSLATGNIDFDGSVHVKGDVADGLTIQSTGEVVVNGVVGKATIIAKGNVIIDQGLIGGIHTEEAKADMLFGSEIRCDGDFSARFVTCAKIRAKGSVKVAEYISHSDVEAGDSVLLGRDRGKGHLIGGTTRAFHRVEAKTLGTKGSVPTTIRIGADADTVPKLRKVMQRLNQIDNLLYDLYDDSQKLATQTRLTGSKQTREKLAHLEQQQKALQEEQARLKKKEKHLQSLLVKSKAARVVAKRQIYTNVWVHILHTGKKVTEDTRQGTFRFDARQTILEQ